MSSFGRLWPASVSIRIDAVGVEHADRLRRLLLAVVDAEDVSVDAEQVTAHVNRFGDVGDAVVSTMVVVEEWLAAEGLGSTCIHLLGRSYRVSSPFRSGSGGTAAFDHRLAVSGL